MSDWNTIDRAAAALGVKQEARRKWRERGRVPYRWRIPIMQKAVTFGEAVDPALFDEAPAKEAA
jgi:hypothetical protein